MILPIAPCALLALFPLAALIGGTEASSTAQVSVRQRVVIRIPRMPPAPPRVPTAAVAWKERKGPKCVPSATLAGALISKPRTIDLVVTGGGRYRAQFDKDCRALDFYSGFYLKRSPDGMICADRDAIRSRSGRACAIDRFRRLEPVPPGK